MQIILDYDTLCRSAIGKGADLKKLIAIEARERIGRAKSVPASEYKQSYEVLAADMADQIK